MSKPEIVEKLNRFLQSHIPLTAECHLVYLLVECRKLLDRDNDKQFPLLRFYCDWAVHTAKDRITNEIKAIMEKVFEELRMHMHDPAHEAVEVARFMYMGSLQVEMSEFLGQHALPRETTDDRNCWYSFVALLGQVLVDQPIHHPCKGIERFLFLPVHAGSVSGMLEFTEPINGKNYFQYTDTYEISSS